MLSWDQVISFFATFEDSLVKLASNGEMQTIEKGKVTPRDEEYVLGLLSNYSKTEQIALGLDFSDGITLPADFPEKVDPESVSSFVLNFGRKCEIYINSMKDTDGSYVVNYCHRRFCLIKEAVHVILRDEFSVRNFIHPDVKSPEAIYTTLETLIYLPFSIIDFDDDEYPDISKVENYAELLAIWLLYPLDDMANDRKVFLDRKNNNIGQLDSTFEYADSYKVPQRYVDLLFRWDRFDELYSYYKQKRDGM